MATHDLIMVAGKQVSRQGTVSVVVRRSFRMGLWLGLLAGILVAVMKVVQTRREDQQWDPNSDQWPPVETPPVETAGVETAPLETAPVETATVETAPVETATVETAPVETATVETAPLPSPEAVAPTPSLGDELASPLVEEVEPVDEAPEPVPPPTVTKEPVVRRAAPAKKAAKKTTKARAKKAAKTAKATKAVKKARRAAPALAWVDADDGICPPSHPVKAKLSSRLFHLPGMAFYNRTRAERCYADEESAVRDGFTKSKR